MSVRHLLFDFGGPVLRSPFELREQAAPGLGVDPSEIPGGPFDPSDALWARRVAGEITERDYWREVAARFDLDVVGFMRHFFEPGGDHLIRPGSVALLDDAVAADRRVGLLTNDLTAFHDESWQEPISVLRRFDPLVDLSRSGTLKPDPRAYETAIEAMGCPAGDIVFVDDHVDNFEGGAAAGLIAIHFDVTDPAGSLAEARDALRL